MQSASTAQRRIKGLVTKIAVPCLDVIKAEACNFIKKQAPPQVFLYDFCKISKNTFVTENLFRWLLL